MFKYFKSKKRLIQENKELLFKLNKKFDRVLELERKYANLMDTYTTDMRICDGKIRTLNDTIADLRNKLNSKITLSLLQEVMKSYEEKEEK